MTDWTDGYVADLDYTFGYFSELNPLRLRLAFLNMGLQFPEVGVACELGFGQGMSINLHAAASVVQWFGTDFNPSHTKFAKQLSDAAGTNTQLFEQSFYEFCSRCDLPDFDYIALHGVWSWISDENRAVLVDFIYRKLKVGGVVYVSYNTQPGWATMLPVRDLLAQHAEVMGSQGQGAVARFDTALQFAQQLLAVNPNYVRANPNIAERLKTLTNHNPHYLVHEYFNANWQPLSFAETNQLLAEAKLNFACSANYLDHVDTLNLTDAQQDFLTTIADDTFRETVQDFCTNQQFRRDYWVKGEVYLNALEQIEALRAQRVILAKPRADVVYKVEGHLGESVLHEAIYNPILDMLSTHQIFTLAQIEQAVSESGINFDQMLQALMILIGNGVVFPVQDEDIIAAVKPHTDKLNYYLCYKARGNDELSYLASPVTGGGIVVARFQQLFLLARAQGYNQPEQWAQFVWSILAMQNQSLIRDGVPLTSDSDNIKELMVQADAFANKQLPVLIALGICN
jgi:SAM-dependent methyltransferase